MLAAVASLAMAVTSFVFAVHVVFAMKLGPTAVTLAPGRGVHTGDALALPSVVLGTLYLALAIVWARAAWAPVAAPVVVPYGWEQRSRIPRRVTRAA